jgi:hypothetical protein
MEDAIENKRLIEEGEFRYLNGCPSSYGLDHYVGLCEEEKIIGNVSQMDQCECCWRKALNVSE